MAPFGLNVVPPMIIWQLPQIIVVWKMVPICLVVHLEENECYKLSVIYL